MISAYIPRYMYQNGTMWCGDSFVLKDIRFGSYLIVAFIVFLNPSRLIQQEYLKAAHTCFLVNPFSSTVHDYSYISNRR